jgi:hypothetical protein
VVLPEIDVDSNTVYTVTVVDAITSILAGQQVPGAFDLTNAPQWTWRRVYEYEARELGVECRARTVPGATTRSVFADIIQSLRRMAGGLPATPFVRRQVDQCLALAPRALNERAQASWLQLRARADIAALAPSTAPAEELSWVRLDRHSLRDLRPTDRLLADEPYARLQSPEVRRWPPDLRLAIESVGSRVAHEPALKMR